ncbi:MAG: hypothetical protein IKN24_09065 [Lachnospiraceae bacterium]|nr:hypothetical protein [Lachnospiraceae bacterium]
MRRKKNAVRALAVIMAFVLFCVLLPTASSAYDIDDSGFQPPELPQRKVYYWHEGPPPKTSDYKEYKVLVVWDDTYYWVAGKGFRDAMDGESPAESGHYIVDVPYALSSGNRPMGYYDKEEEYSNTSGLVANLPFDYKTLAATGVAVSENIPADLPTMIRVDNGSGTGNYLIGCSDYDGRIEGAKYWLHGVHKFRSKVAEVLGFDDHYVNSLDWGTEHYYYTKASATGSGNVLVSNNYNGHTFGRNVPLDRRTWKVENVGGAYRIYTKGDFAQMVSRYSGSLGSTMNKEMKSYADTNGYNHSSVVIGHAGNKIHTKGDQNWTSTFRIFYAEEEFISYLKTDVTVTNGAVYSMDGPVCIEPGVEIIVEDGGVLSVTGWIINNGMISIEKGGTMIAQNDTRRIGEQVFANDATIATHNSRSGTQSGLINISGLMIVMSKAKVCGGGLTGIYIRSDAQVVNYGAIISENFRAQGDYLVDMRGDSAQIITGKGPMDAGYSLMYTTLKQDGKFAGMGNLEKARETMIQCKSAFTYGDSKDKVFKY